MTQSVLPVTQVGAECLSNITYYNPNQKIVQCETKSVQGQYPWCLWRLWSRSEPIIGPLVWTGMFKLLTPCEAGELKSKERHLKRTLLCVKIETKQQLLSEVRPRNSAASRPKCVSRWILGRCRAPGTARSRPSSGPHLSWQAHSRSGGHHYTITYSTTLQLKMNAKHSCSKGRSLSRVRVLH